MHAAEAEYMSGCCSFDRWWSALQDVRDVVVIARRCRRSRRRRGCRQFIDQPREEETATNTNDLHQWTTKGIGKGFCRDSLSRHLHQRGDRHEDGSNGGQSPGPHHPPTHLIFLSFFSLSRKKRRK